jgi:hypothetical protein
VEKMLTANVDGEDNIQQELMPEKLHEQFHKEATEISVERFRVRSDLQENGCWYLLQVNAPAMSPRCWQMRNPYVIASTLLS